MKRLKQKKNAEIHVIELNIHTVKDLKRQNIDVIYGDALRPGILEQAGIIGAGILAITVQIEDGFEIIKRARSLNPDIKVLVRRDLFRGSAKYRLIGAEVAIGEGLISEKMANDIGKITGVKA